MKLIQIFADKAQSIPTNARLAIYLVLAALLFVAMLVGWLTEAELDQALDFLAAALGLSAFMAAANVKKG